MKRPLSRLSLPILALSMSLFPPGAHAAMDVVIDPFDDVAACTPNEDGGNPPEITLSPDGHTGSALRLVYTDKAPHWGNVRHPLQLPPESSAIRFRLKVNSAAETAAFHIWLFEKDKDGYLIRVRPDDRELHELTGDAWHDVTIPFSAFRFQPRGNGKRSFLTIDHMLFGCNYGDFDVCIDDLAIVSEAVAPAPMPRSASTDVARGPSGAVAILTEPTAPKSLSHADPRHLRQLLEKAGFGVAMLRAGDLCDPALLTKSRFDVLVIPCAPFYPREGRDALLTYLREGGTFLSVGGYAFDDLRIYSGHGWTEHSPTVTARDMDKETAPALGINTRFGQHGDTMHLDQAQLGVFDPSYELQRGTRLRAAPSQHLIPQTWSADTPVAGFAAVAMTGSNSPVFPDVFGRWTPLVECVDSMGRNRGAVGALVHNFAGPYANASWAFFGVTNRDLFDGADKGLDTLLIALARRLAKPTFLHSLETDLACYRQGEAVTLSVTPVLRGRVADSATVHFEVGGKTIASVSVDGTGGVSTTWAPGRFDADFYAIRAVLDIDGKPVDEMSSGFVVWDESVLARGPSVDLDENYLRFRDVPTFVVGANQTGMMWYSANEDPLVWDADFARMNDCGINMLRILHFSPFAREANISKPPFQSIELRNRPLRTQRQTDAIVQLAQKHNVIVFLTLHDWLPVELRDEELHAQRDWARFWVDRYRDVPGMMYDVQNEPRVAPPDRPHVRTELERWLTIRYGDLGKAREAWGIPADAAFDLGIPRNAEWTDLRVVDLDLFRTVLFNRWTAANASGVRNANPDALLTVGHLQHLTAADKLLGARNLHFTNTHFYGSIRDFRTKLKLIDRRFEGKSLSLGEFGSRTAHDARTHGRIGDPADESVLYYLSIGHYALGMGASFIANWDWKEFRDCVFPWGINHADLVPKPVLEAYRNMALLFRTIEPRYEEPQLYLLVPDSHRFGPRTVELHDGLLQATEWLLAGNAPFGVINEQSLASLPAGAKALVWPFPYCPGDETFGRVTDFVKKGGALLFTGDVRFSELRKPERLGRLAALGLTDDDTPAQPFAKSARRLSAAPQWSTCGKGRVCRVPRPIELLRDGAGQTLYSAFVREAAVPRLEVEPGDGSAHAFIVPHTAGYALAVYNDTDTRRTIRIAETAHTQAVSLELDGEHPGLVVFGRDNAAIGAICQGTLVADGKQVLSVTGNQGAVSLDERDLRNSSSVLIAPFGPGDIHIARAAPAPVVCEIGEFHRGHWTPLAENMHASIDANTPYDLRLLTDRDAIPQARRAVEKLLKRQ